jgi:hypothetical protein
MLTVCTVLLEERYSFCLSACFNRCSQFVQYFLRIGTGGTVSSRRQRTRSGRSKGRSGGARAGAEAAVEAVGRLRGWGWRREGVDEEPQSGMAVAVGRLTLS